MHLLFERPAQRLQDIAFHLIANTVGIDDQATVVSDGQTSHLHSAGRIIYRNLRYHGNIGQLVFVACEGQTATSTGGE